MSEKARRDDMSEVIELTASSQLKSANATSEIKYHSGRENRAKYKHANEDIDPSRSHLNKEFDVLDRDALLHAHYDEKIAKHNAHNRSKARRWDSMEQFLATFEGKSVKGKGERWATASQISYLGGKESLNPVWEGLIKAGVPEEELIEAYTNGYGEYIEEHNKRFPTLPIYHSDIHFDETTPHGHDAIVVMGHTEKGNPSDSINNALAEKYGYMKVVDGKKVNTNQENMRRYREENDMLLFDSITPRLEEVAQKYGYDIEFKPIRTGQEGSVDYKTYKRNKDLEEREKEVQEREEQVEMRTKAQKKVSEKNRERSRELKERAEGLDAREVALEQQRAAQIAREKELREKEERMKAQEQKLVEREKVLAVKERNVGRHDKTAQAVALAVLKGDERRKKAFEMFEKNGVLLYKPEDVQRILTDSITEANAGVRRRNMGGSHYINRQIAEQGGPEI